MLSSIYNVVQFLLDGQVSCCAGDIIPDSKFCSRKCEKYTKCNIYQVNHV